jgi:hypothetical protein
VQLVLYLRANVGTASESPAVKKTSAIAHTMSKAQDRRLTGNLHVEAFAEKWKVSRMLRPTRFS